MTQQVNVSLDPISGIDAIDILRGIALFGVMAVNISTGFRASLFAQFLGEADANGGLEQCVEWGVSVIVESKAMCIFSFLFGVGLAIQFESLSKRRRPHYWLLRRLLVLLLFGLVHMSLIWNGDILTEYAVAALLVLPLLRARTSFLKVLCTLCFLLFAIMPMLPLPWDWPSQTAFAEHVHRANALLPTANWLEVQRFSTGELPWIAMLHAYAIARTVALLLLGVVIWRAGGLRLAPTYGNAYALTAASSLVCGFILTLMARAHLLGPFGITGQLVEPLAPVVLAFGYGVTILWAVSYTSAKPLLARFAPVGRMAFSNYIGQSLVFCIIFFGYGFGQFARLDRVQALVIGTALFLAQIAISTWWLRRYRYGPIEWLWRSLMYGRRQKMRLLNVCDVEPHAA